MSRLLHALCVDSCFGPECSCLGRAEARPMVCGAPRATSVLRRARGRDVRSHIGAQAGQTGADERDGGSGVTCGVRVTLWGCVPCLEYMLGQCLSV